MADTQCDVTGFLIDDTEDPIFEPHHKTAFLKALKRHGNQSKASDDLGFPFKIILKHLAKDLIFKERYEETLLEMRHAIEGKLYSKGLKNGGGREAKMWLEAHFPDDYAPASKKPARKEKENPLLEGLLKKAGE